jgi:hypothetical protein
VAVLISQINRHPVFLGVLGIIPNQIRTLLKECNFGDPENALQDISRTLFFAGFRIWSKRQQLVSRVSERSWTKTYKGIKTKGKKRKKENIEDKLIESNCMNHFITFAVIAIYLSNVQQNVPVEILLTTKSFKKISSLQSLCLNIMTMQTQIFLANLH